MTQDEALDILKTGANVFLSGEPGAGKTFTINKYVSYLKERDIEPAITASTGIASTHIGGMTIHSWSGIGIKENLTPYDLDKISTSEYIVRRIRKTKVLIIDEISMLRAQTLDMVDAVCREIKANTEPFGGIQVVLVGDFFQLPPIDKKSQDENLKKQTQLMQEKVARFAYEASSWVRLNPVVCYLSEQHRQEDETFLDLLLAIRKNKLEDQHYEYLKTRYIAKDSLPTNITKLFSHNLDVDRVNNEMLSKIEGDSVKYEMESSGTPNLSIALKKSCLSPEILYLKKGAIVMCTKNNPKEHFVNGTLGTVVDFDAYSGHPIIQTHTGRNITISPMDWSVEENGKIKAKITQMPLRLAWAITVHKSQGMSLDAAIMDLSLVFEYGQGYVALSRVRQMSGLYLLGMNNKSLEVHPDILEQDSIFLKESDKARQIFGTLTKDELLNMHKNFIIAMGGKWKIEKEDKKIDIKKENHLEKIREKHQNAYKKWTEEEEQKVIEEYKKGTSIKNIAKIFGRQTGGIKARLVKVGLIAE